MYKLHSSLIKFYFKMLVLVCVQSTCIHLFLLHMPTKVNCRQNFPSVLVSVDSTLCQCVYSCRGVRLQTIHTQSTLYFRKMFLSALRAMLVSAESDSVQSLCLCRVCVCAESDSVQSLTQVSSEFMISFRTKNRTKHQPRSLIQGTRHEIFDLLIFSTFQQTL